MTANCPRKGSFRFECLSILNAFFYYKVSNLMWKPQKRYTFCGETNN